MVQQPPRGPGPPHCQGFMITAHLVGQLTTLTETPMLPVGFEPRVPRSINIKLLLIAELKGRQKG
jgi:hypothetical protein